MMRINWISIFREWLANVTENLTATDIFDNCDNQHPSNLCDICVKSFPWFAPVGSSGTWESKSHNSCFSPTVRLPSGFGFPRTFKTSALVGF